MAPHDAARKGHPDAPATAQQQGGFASQFNPDMVELETWRPDTVGDTLIGEVLAIDGRSTRHSERANDCPVLTVRNEADATTYEWWAFHRVAKSELMKQRPRIGERIGVQYLGMHEHGYVAYRVRVDRPDASFNWDSVAEDGEAPPASFLSANGTTQALPEKPEPGSRITPAEFFGEKDKEDEKELGF